MIARISYGLRVLAVGFSFVLFGVGGLVLALVVFPLLNLGVRNQERRQSLAQRIVQRVWRLFIRIAALVGAVSYEYVGAEKLDEDSGVMVVANHPSLLDVVFMMALMRRTQCVVKADVARNPFMAGAVRAAKYIPNTGDPERLIDDCAAALRAGNNVLIFPEGSRTVPGKPRRMQRGFAYAALKAGAPVRVATITVEPPMLRKGEPWYRISPRRAHWTIRVHERIDVYDVTGQDPLPVAARRLCGRVDELMGEMLRA